MPDLSITTPQLTKLAPVLTDVLKLTPPPTPKGRYCLQKAAGHVDTAFAAYVKKEQAHIQLVAVKDESGNVKFTPVTTADGTQGLHYEVLPELKDEAAAELAKMQAETITLAGCRMITHAELGACPITGHQEKILIQCGLLEDSEPA